MRDSEREPTGDAGFLREAEQEQELEQRQEPRINEDGMVRDRQAAQHRDRLRDASDAVRDLPDNGADDVERREKPVQGPPAEASEADALEQEEELPVDDEYER